MPLFVSELAVVTLGRVPYVDPLVGEVHGHILLDHGELGCLNLGHLFNNITAPDTVLTGVAPLGLAHPQFLGLEEVDALSYLGVMAGLEGGVGG